MKMIGRMTGMVTKSPVLLQRWWDSNTREAGDITIKPFLRSSFPSFSLLELFKCNKESIMFQLLGVLSFLMGMFLYARETIIAAKEQ